VRSNPHYRYGTARAVGLTLVVPALVLLVVSYVVPAWRIVRWSFTEDPVFKDDGFTTENYGDLFRPGQLILEHERRRHRSWTSPRCWRR
jgi:ABC-type sugar transport system permease subunit